MSDVPLYGVGRRESAHRFGAHRPRCRSYLTKSVCKVVLQKSIFAQIRRLVLCCYYYKELVDECVGELTFARRFYKHFLSDKVATSRPARDHTIGGP